MVALNLFAYNPTQAPADLDVDGLRQYTEDELQAIATALSTADLASIGFHVGAKGPPAATYSVTANDNGLTLNFSGNVFHEITYGPPSGYSATHRNIITNNDGYAGQGTGRGRRINLNGAMSILYPGQSCIVFNNGGAWDKFPRKQKWFQGNVDFCVDTGGGPRGTVDGLGTGAGAFNVAQDAASAIYYDSDMQGSASNICLTAGQTFAQQLNLGGQGLGSNVIFVKGNGGVATLQTPVSGGSILSVGDNAEAIVQDLTFNSSNNVFGHASIYLHSNGLVDAFQNVRINGNGGANDCGVFLDNGPCIFAIFNTILFSNTFRAIMYSDRGGNISIGATVSPTGALAPSRLLELRAPGYTSIGTAITAAGWGSPGNSTVALGHVLLKNGTTIPGGVVSVAGTGPNPMPGFINDT